MTISRLSYRKIPRSVRTRFEFFADLEGTGSAFVAVRSSTLNEFVDALCKPSDRTPGVVLRFHQHDLHVLEFAESDIMFVTESLQYTRRAHGLDCRGLSGYDSGRGNPTGDLGGHPCNEREVF